MFIENWKNDLVCTDCGSGVVVKNETEIVACGSCGKQYFCKNGIWEFLPSQIENMDGKDREKEGWKAIVEEDKVTKDWDPTPEFFLMLPDYPHPYYQDATRLMKCVMEIGKPWEGKRVLELGAAECWATRMFVEAGAVGAALDYDPFRMQRAQVLLDRLPIEFTRFTGDAECLPFGDESLDLIFCCSVLHHFFDQQKAVNEIARTLKPGGRFIAIQEAFHPPYYTEKQKLSLHEDTPFNIEHGINEQSFTAGQYKRWFNKAGMQFDLIHSRWDFKVNGNELEFSPGIAIFNNPDYVPHMFAARTHIAGWMGKISRFFLKTGLWKIAANPLLFKVVRYLLLNWSTKEKIILAVKKG